METAMPPSPLSVSPVAGEIKGFTNNGIIHSGKLCVDVVRDGAPSRPLAQRESCGRHAQLRPGSWKALEGDTRRMAFCKDCARWLAQGVQTSAWHS